MDEVPTCKLCGSTFTPYRPWQEFCSPPCRDLFYSRYVRNACGEAVYAIDEEIKRRETENEKSADG